MSDFLKILRSAIFDRPAIEMEGHTVEKSLTVSSTREEFLNYCRATGDNPEKYNPEKNEFPPFYYSRFAFAVMKDIFLNPIYKINFFRTVHAWQSMEFYNMLLQSSMDRAVFRVQNIKAISIGWYMEVETLLYADDVLVMKCLTGLIIRYTKKISYEKGEIAGGGDALTEVSLETYRGQELDYSNISGDRNLLHRNSLVARLLGFRGRVLHGLCTMTVTSNVLIRELLNDDWTKMKSISCNISAPVYAGEPLSLSYRKIEDGDYGFLVQDQYGKNVITKGRIVIK